MNLLAESSCHCLETKSRCNTKAESETIMSSDAFIHLAVIKHLDWDTSMKKYFLAVTLTLWAQVSIFASVTMIVDANTTQPGSNETFSDFDWIANDNGTLVFAARGSDDEPGIYRFRDGDIELVANTNSTLPDGGALFDLRYPSIDGNDVDFFGRAATTAGTAKGIYRVSASGISIIADTMTLLSESAGAFTGFGPPAIANGTVAFQASTENGLGVYAFDGVYRTIADTATTIPGRSENFQQFGQQVRIVEDGFVFSAGSDAHHGIFIAQDGQLSSIAEKDSILTTIANFSVSTDSTLFRGIDEEGLWGLYESPLTDSLFPTLVADASMHGANFNPDFPFPRSSTPLIDEDGLFFQARMNSGEDGLYWLHQSELIRLAMTGDQLDGGIVSRIQSFNGEELSGGQVAFIVEHVDGGSAIYLASVPEPSAFLLFLIGVIGLHRIS